MPTGTDLYTDRWGNTYRREFWELASRDASLGVGHIWTNTECPAYRTLDPNDCNCRET